MYFPILLLSVITLVASSDVLDLSDSDFAEKVGEHNVVLVEFFAPWCGHCKRLAPEYEKAAATLKKDDTPVPLAKVDCTANTETCGKFGVSGYPTLKIFRGGEVAEDYNGPREADGIVKTMRAKAGPVSKELNSVADAEKFLNSQDYGVVGFFEASDSKLAETFQKVAGGLNTELRFAHTTNKEIRDKYAFNDDIVLFQPKRLQSKFEDAQQKYTDDAVVHKIKPWLQAQCIGLCGHRTMENQDKFSKPNVIAYYDVDYVKNVKGTNYWRNRVMKVAKKFKDGGKQVFFGVSNLNDFSHELSEFGLDSPKGDKPVVAGRDAKGQKFVMEAEFGMDTLEQFVNDLLDGNLTPYMKSEPVPTQDEAVKVVVAKNFDEIVADDKDVLVEFYAPWCGHCKSLEPKYKELAEKMADEPNIVIAKMDATANDVPPSFEVQGFPTIYFKPAGEAPKKYNGGREVNDFVKYLAAEAKEQLKGYNRKGKKTGKTEL